MDFASNCERTPVDHRQLYDLVVARLEDVRTDLEDGDASVASLVRRISVETELRNYFGHWLRPAPQGFLGHLIAREFSQEECRDEEAR